MEEITTSDEIYVQQKKEWTEIIVDFETVNRYAVMDQNKKTLGMVAERGGGIFHHIKRAIFRSHRAFEIDVIDNSGKSTLMLSRNFFFFFSDLFVTSGDGQKIGKIHRRFGILHKKYDLYDQHDNLFAKIKSPIWRLWTFPVVAASTGQEIGEISKKWGGMLREIFTDADTFRVQYKQHPWTSQQRATVFAAAVSIDFDFFEDNQGRSD